MSDEHVYLSLAEGHEDGDSRWAFGTGFEDPLHGVDTALPAGVDAAELAAHCLALGDDALVGAQRLAEWCTRAPELEEEVALANIGLDLLGQARLLYSRAGQVDGTGRDEDAYAYFRDAADFRNVRLAELPCGDFAFSMARLLVTASWRLAVFQRLARTAQDPVLAAIAAKGVNELTYHRQYAAEWTVRLGDGTEESHRRMRAGLEQVAPYLEELFTAGATSGVDPDEVRGEVTAALRQVTEAAGLPPVEAEPLPGHGRDGDHTDHLAPLLAELQGIARAHPGAVW
ncbi:1,2-phenylacetyl-CoA epoxidase subunit PaaC [Actinacidiphila sp. bgisy160]|uniref:1,2-phenylacetyl-CoA epoxidase subunit PaaC n=1 Tax=Actinacidiphila sp. bgisy160 TaxID=3413796 RepID=UPI003D7530D7